MFCNNGIAFGNSCANVGFGFCNLILKLLLELAELGALQVGPAKEKFIFIKMVLESLLDEEPKLHPLPSLCDHHGADGSLGGEQSQLLIFQFLELPAKEKVKWLEIVLKN